MRKREPLRDLMQDLRVDVLCLQEVSAVGLAWIREALGQPEVAAAGRDDGADQGEHVPILLLDRSWAIADHGTFWFSRTPDVPSRGWGAACPRICTWARLRRRDEPGRELAVFNLHLDHASRRAREDSVRLLGTRLAVIPPACPIMLCGDFNFRPRSRAYALLRAEPRGFVDGGETSRGEATWDGYGPFGFGRARIDYVFAGPSVELRDYKVLDNRSQGRRLSDHHPVRVTFGLGH